MEETESKSVTISEEWSQAAGPLGYREVFICAKPKKHKGAFKKNSHKGEGLLWDKTL